MSQGFHICDSTCPPLCKHRQAGAGGIGRPIASPTRRGDTPREKSYRATHRTCEAPGCHYPAWELHHVDRRKNRATSRLKMYCILHHQAVHTGELDDGRRG